jgi:hypothetical protein
MGLVIPTAGVPFVSAAVTDRVAGDTATRARPNESRSTDLLALDAEELCEELLSELSAFFGQWDRLGLGLVTAPMSPRS